MVSNSMFTSNEIERASQQTKFNENFNHFIFLLSSLRMRIAQWVPSECWSNNFWPWRQCSDILMEYELFGMKFKWKYFLRGFIFKKNNQKWNFMAYWTAWSLKKWINANRYDGVIFPFPSKIINHSKRWKMCNQWANLRIEPTLTCSMCRVKAPVNGHDGSLECYKHMLTFCLKSQY